MIGKGTLKDDAPISAWSGTEVGRPQFLGDSGTVRQVAAESLTVYNLVELPFLPIIKLHVWGVWKCCLAGAFARNHFAVSRFRRQCQLDTLFESIPPNGSTLAGLRPRLALERPLVWCMELLLRFRGLGQPRYHVAMGHKLWLHFRVDFDVHQGYRVLTHSHVSLGRRTGGQSGVCGLREWSAGVRQFAARETVRQQGGGGVAPSLFPTWMCLFLRPKKQKKKMVFLLASLLKPKRVPSKKRHPTWIKHFALLGFCSASCRVLWLQTARILHTWQGLERPLWFKESPLGSSSTGTTLQGTRVFLFISTFC